MRVSQYLIIIPVLAQVIVTLAVCAAHHVNSFQGRSNDHLKKTYSEQFELPVLFYAASAFAYAFRIIDEWQLAFALLFVVAHMVHTILGSAGMSTTTRHTASLLAVLAVASMWFKIAMHFAQSGF